MIFKTRLLIYLTAELDFAQLKKVKCHPMLEFLLYFSNSLKLREYDHTASIYYIAFITPYCSPMDIEFLEVKDYLTEICIPNTYKEFDF